LWSSWLEIGSLSSKLFHGIQGDYTMTKSIRIYQQFSGKDTLLALWSDLPVFYFNWFSQTFSSGEISSESGFFDVRNKRFTNFLLACGKFANLRSHIIILYLVFSVL